MIYRPARGDTKLLSFSRELVRDSLVALRNSESIARAQRIRDELVNAEPARGATEPAEA
ncbi:hypothetical protein JQ617_05405 [Bradyrhizobium sp. KB893862 SZCCT0404]|uniref:hypothetical protein n=1 Tax=Bradyrhizobium sp. KB893862 SZCCT0404 TaxID=2807672 RepID=UPI001BA5EADA|nr:hypothetical protein [Bradyrhizobium sp. KB893862 SZCCT0404]MBR1173383.1 hypothetical protein [Bradyrhizobium sp. KB893862 SZCCT0404]